MEIIIVIFGNLLRVYNTIKMSNKSKKWRNCQLCISRTRKVEQTHLVSDPDLYKSNPEQDLTFVCMTAFTEGSLEKKEKELEIWEILHVIIAKYLIEKSLS